jgi:hypothetical protein
MDRDNGVDEDEEEDEEEEEEEEDEDEEKDEEEDVLKFSSASFFFDSSLFRFLHSLCRSLFCFLV